MYSDKDKKGNKELKNLNIFQEKQPPWNQRVTGGRRREENVIESEIVRRIEIHCDKEKREWWILRNEELREINNNGSR